MAEESLKLDPLAQRIEIAHVNLSANPFPEWLIRQLGNLPGMTYDDLNMAYYARFKTRDDAERYAKWIHGPFLDWSKHDPEKQKIVERLTTRVCLLEESIAAGMDVDVF